MELLSLPDEILNKIAMLSVAAHHFDAEFRGLLKHGPLPPGRVYCVNQGVLGLSETNSRLHRICFPILFSAIAVCVPGLDPVRDIEEENLEYLKLLIERWLNIANEIRYLTLPSDMGYPRIWLSSRIIPILALLPRVVQLPLFRSVSEELIEVLNARPSVESVATDFILETPDRLFSSLSPDAHRSPSFMKKIILYSLYDTRWEQDTGHPDEISSYLRLGMNINKLCTESRIHLNGHTFNHVNTLSLLFSDDDELARETSVDWLSSFLTRVSSLSSIWITNTCLDVPLISDLDVAVQRSDILNVAFISQYRIDAVNAPSSPSHDWNRDWRTAHVSLSMTEFPISPSTIDTFASNLSSLTSLEITFGDKPGEPVSITESDLLSDQVRQFRTLHSLSLRYLRFPHGMTDYDEQRGIVEILARALHARIPSLQSILIMAMGNSKHDHLSHSFEVHVRQCLVVDGGGMEVAVIPLGYTRAEMRRHGQRIV